MSKKAKSPRRSHRTADLQVRSLLGARHLARRIVPMDAEMALLLRRVATNQVAVHARNLELVGLADLGNHATSYAVQYHSDERLIRNLVISPALDRPVGRKDGAVPLWAQECRL